MRAVVLVGGFGTRLRPLTFTTPKPMLPVGHRPIIENLVTMLARAGVDEVVLALGFRHQPFLEAFPDGRCAGVPLHYAVEPEPLDTGGAIRFAAEHAGVDETFVVVNGDVLTDLDLGRLITRHCDTGAEATIHLTPVDDPSAYGVVELDDTGRVIRFVEKPAPGTAPSNLINAGTYVFEPSVLSRIPSGRKVSIERETFPTLVDEGGLFAMSTDDYWIDTGRPDTYRLANFDVLDGHRRVARCEAVEAGAVVAESASVEHSLVSSGARVGARSNVRDSIVLASAIIGDDCDVIDSIVMGRVESGARVSHAVIGADGVVNAGSVVDSVSIPDPTKG